MTFLLRRERGQIRKQVEAWGPHHKGQRWRAWTFTFGITLSAWDSVLVLLWTSLRYCPLGLYWTKFSSYNVWHFPNESWFVPKVGSTDNPGSGQPRAWAHVCVHLSSSGIAWLTCLTQTRKPSPVPSHVNYKPSETMAVLVYPSLDPSA